MGGGKVVAKTSHSNILLVARTDKAICSDKIVGAQQKLNEVVNRGDIFGFFCLVCFQKAKYFLVT